MSSAGRLSLCHEARFKKSLSVHRVLKPCLYIPSREAGTGGSLFTVLFSVCFGLPTPYALLCSAVLGSRTAPDVRRFGHMVAVLPVVTDCTACPAVQRAAVVIAARYTQRISRVHRSRHFPPAGTGQLSLAGLHLCFTITACSPSAVASSPPMPTHFFAYGFTWVFGAFCGCCFALAVCRSFG